MIFLRVKSKPSKNLWFFDAPKIRRIFEGFYMFAKTVKIFNFDAQKSTIFACCAFATAKIENFRMLKNY